MFTMLMVAVASCLAAATAMAQAKFVEFPIANGSDTTFAISGAYDGANYLVGIQGDLLAHYNITAQLVSSSGSLIGSRISVGRTGGAPYVAFDGTNYLMVWGDDANYPNSDVYWQFINTSGNLVGAAFPIVASSNGEDCDGMAFGDTAYLVTFSIDDALYGQRLSKAGNLIGGAIQISSNAVRHSAIAFDGTNFLVVWQCGWTPNYDVQGRFVSESGSTTDIFTINETPSSSHNPLSIAFDGANYLVAWNKDIGPGYPSPTVWDIYARKVSPSGTMGSPEFPITIEPDDQLHPSIAFDGANYLITWNSQTSLDTMYTRGRFFDTTGVPLDTAFTIFSPAGSKVSFYGRHIYGGTQFFAFTNKTMIDTTGGGFSFGDVDIYGTFIPKYTGVAGNPADPVNVSSFKIGQNSPNPFNQSTMINYQLTKPGLVNLAVYNTAGQLVKTLVNAWRQPGSYSVSWDCTGNDSHKVANGVYLARLESQGRAVTTKMVVVR
jgi:hypothetical protein